MSCIANNKPGCNYNPIPKELAEEVQTHIIGSQFALWTEFISSVDHLEYMLLPRMPAAAEIFWSRSDQKDFDDFVRRLNDGHFESWEQQGIRFHPQYYNSRAYEGIANKRFHFRFFL